MPKTPAPVRLGWTPTQIAGQFIATCGTDVYTVTPCPIASSIAGPRIAAGYCMPARNDNPLADDGDTYSVDEAKGVCEIVARASDNDIRRGQEIAEAMKACGLPDGFLDTDCDGLG